MPNLFFVSDMHFGHRNVIPYCNRPYASVEEMDDALVRNWNATVNSTDTVYHLGDWAFHNYHRIGELNGFIYSIPGNHDQEREKKLAPFVQFTAEIHYLKVTPEVRFVLCHYPMSAWKRAYKYHLHGHCHGNAPPGGPVQNRLDVGIDATRLYRPAHLDEVLERMR